MTADAVTGRGALSAQLPDFPWDTIAAARRRAEQHPGGIVDLSVGTPVDPTPAVARDALTAASDAHGYPQVWGTPAVRQAIIGHLRERWNAAELAQTQVMPVIGTKWLVAWLPTLLNLGEGDVVVIPTTAYPTYRVGAELVGATVVECDDPKGLPANTRLVWINSPANPHGAILGPDDLRAWIDATRASGAVLASDECYGEFAWDAPAHSVLDTSINHGSTRGLLAVMSTSKESNLAGYRAGFVAGDEAIVRELLALGKHTGMMLPTPVLAAMQAVLTDRAHVAEQRDRYLARRALLRPALERVGFRIDHSEGSLYLWATRGEDCRTTLDWLSERGILAAPGDFYGDAGRQHVRIALTATDERIAAAVERLGADFR
ncbi:succinyldiaminopimelate transaminase [Aestuariimicrobium sp. T2.26MG-19.2B]|uniref:succinyldiaminopimelate transaminase n=1 Tax=Aestuariimicrobium sp. T2.26MG-19.2B TaxID=3040679 RepID=UPI002477B529|nr:succinyldiaminopimelate transaminase [Aestuariimicrobium sp. T2.26MG-19.2B]CAI9400179.1 Glutamate-pyruvate aminotransferase AlaC [Aestuariimicrobium sp. T2.26MG-19.2B]